ncbi:MAG TPA: hypothetical protein VKM55_10630 [Candidatus Lokiarchaeia archaeon]|nr:hypothetical protein [Candidatus Lokiarchaeia archaeon]
MDEDNEIPEPSGSEGKITALLQLRARLEQELLADSRKLDDLKKECDLKVQWIHHLDEILSEASFQPASSMLPDLTKTSSDREEEDKMPDIKIKSFNEPVNIKDPADGELLATVNFLQNNIMITMNQNLNLIPESQIFQDFYQRYIIGVFEKEGGKIYLERDDDSGILRSINIMGSFKTELKDLIIKRLTQAVITFRAASKASS